MLAIFGHSIISEKDEIQKLRVIKKGEDYNENNCNFCHNCILRNNFT